MSDLFVGHNIKRKIYLYEDKTTEVCVWTQDLLWSSG